MIRLEFKVGVISLRTVRKTTYCIFSWSGRLHFMATAGQIKRAPAWQWISAVIVGRRLASKIARRDRYPRRNQIRPVGAGRKRVAGLASVMTGIQAVARMNPAIRAAMASGASSKQ